MFERRLSIVKRLETQGLGGEGIKFKRGHTVTFILLFQKRKRASPFGKNFGGEKKVRPQPGANPLVGDKFP